MLRYSLDEPGKKVTLKKEIQNLEQYLIVIQSRKSFAITVNYDVSEEALECSVIRYMIQPIIENSIHYGFENRDSEADNIIWVKAEKIGDELRIRIQDNGVGCNSEITSELNKTLQKGEEYNNSSFIKGTGIGLSNIIKRLRYRFGDEAQLVISSNQGEGMLVQIVVPIKNYDYDLRRYKNEETKKTKNVD